jgi:hypothetical protein
MKFQYLRHSLVGNVTKTFRKNASRDEDMAEIVCSNYLANRIPYVRNGKPLGKLIFTKVSAGISRFI